MVRDAEVVVRLVAGDVTALREIMAQHGAHLTTVALIITRSPDLAAEAVQDAFVHLWNDRVALDPLRGVRGYLTTITSRRARNIVRHENVHTRVARFLFDRNPLGRTGASYNAGDERIETEELDARVAATIDRLPPRCREAFLLHRDAQLSYAEIEAALQMSNVAVRKQISRAMQAIAAAVSAWRSGD